MANTGTPGTGADLDVVVFGATGFTGRLVAEHLAGRVDAPRWGIAGRDEARLRSVADDLGVADLPVVVADAHDPDSLAALVDRTSTVVSTVGPYARHGLGLVAACVASGTDYVDVTGEVPFVRWCIDEHQEAAAESGARIVNCCGYDSVPSDLGVLVAQEAMQHRHGVAARRVSTRVLGGTLRYSGGTMATMLAGIEEAAEDPAAARATRDPYSLLPAGERVGAHTSDTTRAALDPRLDAWTAPFPMEAINARIVRRSNALLDYPWGHEFLYDEAVVTGRGTAGRARATITAAGMGAVTLGLAVDPVRSLAGRVLPEPGTGPDEATRTSGFFKHLVIAEHPDDPSRDVRVEVVSDRDAYTSTGWMAGEAAILLATGECTVDGGVWTPASAFGLALRDRIEAHGGMAFTVLE